MASGPRKVGSGRMRAPRRLALVLAGALGAPAAVLGACSSPEALQGPGGTCLEVTDCQAGLVCIPQANGPNICSSNTSSLVATEEAGPAASVDAQTGEASAPRTDAGAPRADGGGSPPTPEASSGSTPDASAPAPEASSPAEASTSEDAPSTEPEAQAPDASE